MTLLITLAVSEKLAQWLNIDLPKSHSDLSIKTGSANLKTSNQRVSWQAHLIPALQDGGSHTVIFIESHSRYSLLLLFPHAPTIEQLTQAFLKQWLNNLLHLMIENQIITQPALKTVIDQFDSVNKIMIYHRHNDKSIMSHITQAQRVLNQTKIGAKDGMLTPQGDLTDEDTFGLAMHLNKQVKHAYQGQLSKQGFIPTIRLLEDSLFRFAKKLSPYLFKHTIVGNFPNPYLSTLSNKTIANTQITAAIDETNPETNDTRSQKKLHKSIVINLDKYR